MAKIKEEYLKRTKRINDSNEENSPYLMDILNDAEGEGCGGLFYLIMAVVDIIKDQDELASFEYKRCFLWPTRWNTVADLNFLSWTIIDFLPTNESSIPKSPGIYSFIIAPTIANLPHTYLGYIGKTNRTLQERYSEYLREMNNERGRPKLLRLLNKWQGYLKFAYVVNFNGHDISTVESRLNDAFLPPFNDKYSVEINRILNAF